MTIDIILITTGSRPELLQQSLLTVRSNASTLDHSVTAVVDGYKQRATYMPWTDLVDRLIVNIDNCGASASRNIGSSSIPKYRRGKYVLFLDDDVYMCPKWDDKLLELATKYRTNDIISGYSHPFNHAEIVTENTTTSLREPKWVKNQYGVPLVISSVAMFMPWSIFDDVGYWKEPGGAGGSEDYDYSMRAKAKGYGFAVTHEQCILHTGMTSSNGNKIVGYQESVDLNERLVREYGLKDVVFE